MASIHDGDILAGHPAANAASDAGAPIFDAATRERFGRLYPEQPHVLSHALGVHPLLELDSLA
ncbi:MAG: hypothetical protein KKE77_10730, partial [Alphaproteobacteria bacterium]|nr:hypothetical protein [Alphaproteobacteria bacterium]